MTICKAKLEVRTDFDTYAQVVSCRGGHEITDLHRGTLIGGAQVMWGDKVQATVNES